MNDQRTEQTNSPLAPWLSGRDLIIAAVAMALLGGGSFLVGQVYGEDVLLGDEVVGIAIGTVGSIVAALAAWYLLRWGELPLGQLLPFTVVVFAAAGILPLFSENDVYRSITVDALGRFSTWGVLAYVVYVLAAGDGGFRQAVDNLRFRLPSKWYEYVFAVLIFIGYYIVFVGWAFLIGEIEVPSWLELPDNTSDTVEGSGPVVAALLTIGLNPLTEEFVFRSFAMVGLLVWFGTGRMGVLGAAVVSSLIFGLAHVNPVVPFGIVPVTFISGMGFALIYWRTRSLILATVIHMLANSIPFLTMGVETT